MHARGGAHGISDALVRGLEQLGGKVRCRARVAAIEAPGPAPPVHLDIAVDQLGPLRPTRRLGGHRTPVAGL